MAPVVQPPTGAVGRGPAIAARTPDRLPLLALLAATAVSLLGSALTAIAIPWFVLQTTGSAAQTGLTAFAATLPGFAAGIFGGPLIDRIGARRASLIADAVSAIGIGLVPLLYTTVGLPFWSLLALVFVGSALEVPGLTARRSVLPELAAQSGVRLERVNSAYESLQHLSLLLGPPVAGVLIAWLGPSRVLWIDAGTFLLSALLIGVTLPHMRPLAQPGASYRRQLGEGIRFLRGDRLLTTLAVTLTAGNFTGGPLFAVLLPVYASAAFGRATSLGAAVAAAGAGSLLGAMAYGAIGHRLPRKLLWLSGFLIGPIGVWVLALEPPLPVLIAALAIGGLAMGAVNPLLVTIRHERIPPELRGRVFGAFSAAAMAAQPLGMLVGGFLVAGFGFQPAALALAAMNQAIGVALLFVPALRELDAPAASERA